MNNWCEHIYFEDKLWNCWRMKVMVEPTGKLIELNPLNWMFCPICGAKRPESTHPFRRKGEPDYKSSIDVQSFRDELAEKLFKYGLNPEWKHDLADLAIDCFKKKAEEVRKKIRQDLIENKRTWYWDDVADEIIKEITQ